MAEQQPIISFRLPDGRRVDGYLVRLADGQVVIRTREELDRMTPEQLASIEAPK